MDTAPKPILATVVTEQRDEQLARTYIQYAALMRLT